MKISNEELLRRLRSSNNLNNILSTTSLGVNTCSIPEQAVSSTPSVDNLLQESPAQDPSPKENIVEIRSTKRKYTPGISQNRRILAGILASSGEPSTKVARELGITRNQAFHAARTTQAKIAGPRDSSLGRVQELALEKTMLALDLMTPEKFSNADLKELSQVAANMSRVIEKTSPKENADNTTKLIIYAPEQKKESQYKVIDI